MPVAAVDRVVPQATARLLEEPTRERRPASIPAPVAFVVGALRREHHAVERRRPRYEAAVDLPHERVAVDAVRKRAAYELVPQRRVAPLAASELEVLGRQLRFRVDTNAGLLPKRGVLFGEPDPEKNNNAGVEGVATDADGNVFGAEVSTEILKKYMKP